MPVPTLRLFFALWPDAATRTIIGELARQVAAESHGRAVASDNIHVMNFFAHSGCGAFSGTAHQKPPVRMPGPGVAAMPYFVGVFESYPPLGKHIIPGWLSFRNKFSSGCAGQL